MRRNAPSIPRRVFVAKPRVAVANPGYWKASQNSTPKGLVHCRHNPFGNEKGVRPLFAAFHVSAGHWRAQVAVTHPHSLCRFRHTLTRSTSGEVAGPSNRPEGIETPTGHFLVRPVSYRPIDCGGAGNTGGSLKAAARGSIP